MDDRDLDQQMLELSDVELVRMLTVDANAHAPEVRAVAEAEANRRGVPIDEAFIPSAVEADETTPGSSRFEAGGKPIACAHCGHELFRQAATVLLNTRGLTLMRLDWLNRSATALVCANCSLIQLFAQAPDRLDEDE